MSTTVLPVQKPKPASAVPFEEDAQNPKIWFVDHSYMENMYAMFRKVNGELEVFS